MSIFSRLSLRLSFGQAIRQNRLTPSQQTQVASMTDRRLLTYLWVQSLKQQADAVIDVLWTYHRDVLQEKEVCHTLGIAFMCRDVPPLVLTFDYGNQLPQLKEAMVSACRHHEPAYVRSFLQNHVEMDEDVIDALFMFFFSYDWREEEDIYEWKTLYSLFMNNQTFLTESGQARLYALGLDLLPVQDIHSFSDIRSIERYVFNGYNQTIIMLLSEPVACIKTAISLKKRHDPGIHWFSKHFSTLLLLKKENVLHALFEAYPALSDDPHIVEYLLPISAHDFQDKLDIVKKIDLNINDSSGIAALLHEWHDSLFQGGRNARHFVFLIGAGLNIWQGKHEEIGVLLVTHLTEERRQKRRLYISHIERDFHVFLRRNVMEWIEENEPHMGDAAKKAYRLYHYEHDIFA